jgi:hypothetical protein
MPSVPDASMWTRTRKAAATVNPDPEKKSRTFVAPTKDGYMASQLRASEVRRYIFGTVLALPTWISPQAGRKLFLK